MTCECPYHSRNQPFSSISACTKFARFTAAAIGLWLFSPGAQCERLVDPALRFFLGNDSTIPVFDLDNARPQHVTSEYKLAGFAVRFRPYRRRRDGR
jgi:hypothetical protein